VVVRTARKQQKWTFEGWLDEPSVDKSELFQAVWSSQTVLEAPLLSTESQTKLDKASDKS
jgi:hypothetical protein